MISRFARWSLPALLAAVLLGANAMTRDDPEAGPPLAHMVFFTLKDRTPDARTDLADSCRQYLADLDGIIYFSVGTIAEDVDEPGVSVHDFDVALHVVFESKQAKLAYLTDPLHLKFVDENRASFAQARVFDTYLTEPSAD